MDIPPGEVAVGNILMLALALQAQDCIEILDRTWANLYLVLELPRFQAREAMCRVPLSSWLLNSFALPFASR